MNSAYKSSMRIKSSSRGRYQGRALKDLTGLKFGMLTAERHIGNVRYIALWLCTCACGGTIEVKSHHLSQGQVISCGCMNPRNRAGSNNSKWRGHGEISGRFWKVVKNNCLDRQLSFDITIEQAWELFLLQKRRCALSGRNLAFGLRGRDETTASLDRIESTDGYSLANVQWVHKQINIMKGSLPNALFIRTCEEVAVWRKKQQ